MEHLTEFLDKLSALSSEYGLIICSLGNETIVRSARYDNVAYRIVDTRWGYVGIEHEETYDDTDME